MRKLFVYGKRERRKNEGSKNTRIRENGRGRGDKRRLKNICL